MDIISVEQRSNKCEKGDPALTIGSVSKIVNKILAPSTAWEWYKNVDILLFNAGMSNYFWSRAGLDL